MANNPVNRSISIFVETGEATKSVDRLQKQFDNLSNQIKKSTDPKEVSRLTKELDKLAEPLDRAKKKASGELGPSFKDLEVTVKNLGNRLKKMSTEDADFSKTLLQYNKANVSLQEMKKEMNRVAIAKKEITDDKTGGGFLGNMFSSFAGFSLANLAAGALQTLKQIGTQAIQTAIQAEGVKKAFDNLNQPQLLDNLRAATKGTVSDLELMKRAVSANNFQIPLETLGTLLGFAQQRARQTGESVDYLVESIITGIARKSPLILDNLGINVQRINAEFKKTGDFAKAAMNVVNQETAKAGVPLATFADRVDQAKTRFNNALTSMGSSVISVLNSIAQLGEATSELEFDEATRSADKLNASLDPLLQRYDSLKSQGKLNTEQQRELQAVIAGIIKIVPSAAGEFDKYGNALDINRQKIVEFKKESQSFLMAKERDAIKEITEEANKYRVAIGLSANNLNKLVESRKRWGTADPKAAAAFTDGLNSDIAKNQDNLIRTTDVMISKYGLELPPALQKARDAALAAKFGIDELNKSMNKDAPVQSQDTLEALRKEIETTTDALNKAVIGSKDYNTANVKLIELQKRLDSLTNKKNPKENLFSKYLQDLVQTGKELDVFYNGQFEKELLANEKKYDALAAQLKKSLKDQQLTVTQYNNLALQAEELRARERIIITEREFERIEENNKKLQARRKARNTEEAAAEAAERARLTAMAAQQQAKMVEALAKSSARAFSDRVAEAELKAIQAKGRQKLQAEKQVLKAQEQQEIAEVTALYNKKEISEIEFQKRIAAIKANYQQSQADIEWQNALKLANDIINVASTISQAFQALSDSRQQQEDAELARFEKNNDRKKKSLDNQLKNQLISQTEYDRKVSELDKQKEAKEREIRKKQFERQKRLSIVQANINIAQGITAALASGTPPYNIILAAITAAAGAVQLAVISKTKAPEYGKGGAFIYGPSHAQGGLPILNPQTGQKVAEIEGGEVILSKKTVANNPTIVGQLLHNSMYRNGAQLTPAWQSQPVRQINYSGVTQSIARTRYFANGGAIPVFGGDTSTANAAKEEADNALLNTLQGVAITVAGLKQTLDSGILARVHLSDYENQQSRLNNIRNDASAR